MNNERMCAFFEEMNRRFEAITFDDMGLESDHSEIMPADTDVSVAVAENFTLRIPIISAAMDTVTEWKMAREMALHGGLGVIHKNMPPHDQARQVRQVKKYVNGVIDDPRCVSPRSTLRDVLAMREHENIDYHSFLVAGADRKLLGLLTGDDFEFAVSLDLTVDMVMTKREHIVAAPPDISMDEAYALMIEHRKKMLPLVGEDDRIKGMYVHKDIKRIRSGTSTHNVDERGHLRVGAAIGAGQAALERAQELAAAGCDLFHVDTAHGDSKDVLATAREIKRHHPRVCLAVGNVSRGESARRVAEAGADIVFIGQGPGSICTTRRVAAIGKPQLSAIYDCAKALRGTKALPCADGGIGSSSDIVKAIAAGASMVMIGRLLASAREAPGEIVTLEGGTKAKKYRGMGSSGALRDRPGSRERYRQVGTPSDKLVPEGVEGLVPLLGSVREILDQQVGGLRAGLAYVGARTISGLQERAVPFRVSSASVVESRPHDLLYYQPVLNG